MLIYHCIITCITFLKSPPGAQWIRLVFTPCPAQADLLAARPASRLPLPEPRFYSSRPSLPLKQPSLLTALKSLYPTPLTPGKEVKASGEGKCELNWSPRLCA